MRYPDDVRHAALNRAVLTVILSAGLSACGTLGVGSSDSGTASNGGLPFAGMPNSNGPRSDYPVVVGEPYSIAGVEYVPSDALNYDHVGYVTLNQGAMGYSGAHHTLPIPSYVEVTSLDTGRTVLVRLERRGPMTSNHLVALSPAAMVQLGASAETPVRVRRVNPPEAERFALRDGEPASLRMETPQSLLTVLQRRLPTDGGASLRAANDAEPATPLAADETIETIELAASAAAPAPVTVVPPRLPPVTRPVSVQTPATTVSAPPALPPISSAVPNTAISASPTPAGRDLAESLAASEQAEPSAAPVPTAEGNFVVQAASFSTLERAERAAEALGGQVTPSGRYFRVRTGPFLTRGEAEASLANVRRAGYSDARIQTSS